MLNKQPERDYHPIQPDEPKLTENEVEAAVEEMLTHLFDSGDWKANEMFYADIEQAPRDYLTAMLMVETKGDSDSVDKLVAKARAEFVDYAKNAPEWDHIRRSIEQDN